MRSRVVVVMVCAVMVGVVASCGSPGASPGVHDASAAGGDAAVSDAAVSDGPVTMGACALGGYRTSFAAAENPLSEGGKWAQGGRSTGLDWSDVRSSGAIAYGTQTGRDGYNDSIALLSGCGPDHRVSAKIHLAPGAKARGTGTHEVELILRGSYTAHTQHLYECNIGYADASGGFYSQIIRMNGPIGDFTDIGVSAGPMPAVADGDTFTAEIANGMIRTYLNGVPLQTAQDTTHTTGQPGIGFFWRGTENIDDFALTEVTLLSESGW